MLAIVNCESMEAHSRTITIVFGSIWTARTLPASVLKHGSTERYEIDST